MAASHNPFSSWVTAGNYKNDSGPLPSIVGALPYSQSSYPISPDDLVTFTFTSFNSTILNCNVLGPHNRPYFFIVTDTSILPGFTFVRDVGGKNIAVVEWNTSPLLEIQGINSKQKIGDWLKLASNQSCRTMEVQGKTYNWAPYDSYICLTVTSTAAPRTLARISKSFNIVSLEMTSEAIKIGLLEVCVVTAMLLQCGRKID